MSGRGRGRGALARWETNKPGSDLSRAVASVSPLSKEKKAKGIVSHATINVADDFPEVQQVKPSLRTNIKIMQILDVEHFWARLGKEIIWPTYKN